MALILSVANLRNSGLTRGLRLELSHFSPQSARPRFN